MNNKKTLLVCLVILVIGGAVTAIIFFSEPEAERSGATKSTAMLVDVIPAEYGTFQPEIIATGTVQPSEDVMLSPRISGEVMRRSDSFTPGGFIRKGEMLLKIDPADYRNNLALRESDLLQAQADLNIEMGRQDVARQGYNLVEETLPDINEDLVLREPQLNAVKARVEAARAAVNQAKLDLQRTTIRAPFDAHVLTRLVNVGSQVAPGDILGRLVSMDTYWVVVNIPLSKLRWLSFPGTEEEKGAEVQIRDRNSWKEGEYRDGFLYKLIGSLEEQTRLARAIIAVPDPLGHQNDSTDTPQLMINSFVEATIMADEISDVVRLNRDYLRQDDKVWVMVDGKLSIRKVEIVFTDSKYAYIEGGLKDNEMVVTTNLSTVTEGAGLRTEESDTTKTTTD